MSAGVAGTDAKRRLDRGPVPAVPRPRPEPQVESRRRVRRLDGWLLVVALLALPVALYAAKNVRRQIRDGGPLVRGDGLHYFVYLPSLLHDGDLDFANDYELLGLDWPSMAHLSQRTETGHVSNPWPAGTAMLWLPAYLLAHPLALALERGGYPVQADGRGIVYQLSVVLATQIYVLLGLILLYRYLGRWFERPIAVLAVAGIYWGTFLLYYTAVDPTFSHGATFFAAMLVLSLSSQLGHGAPRPGLLGLALGLLTAVRPEAVLLAGFPLAALVRARRGHDRQGQPRRLERELLIFGVGFGLAMAPQLMCWQILYGAPWDPRANPGFLHFSHAPVLALLSSSRNGLYSWSPILLPATLGLIGMLGRDRRFAVLALGTVAAQVGVLAIAADWWGGSAFGGRRFAACLPLFAVGLARALETLVRRPRLGAGLLLGLFLLNNALDVEVARRQPGMGRPVSFRRLADLRYGVLQRELGSPSMLPSGRILSWLNRVPPERMDEIWGSDMSYDLHGRLDFEAPDDRHYLGRGWSAPVSTQTGRTICWVEGGEASVHVELNTGFARNAPEPRRLLLTLSVMPAPWTAGTSGRSGHERARSINLRVLVNGRQTNHRRLSNKFGFLTLRLNVAAPSPWRSGLNEVRLVFSGGPPRVSPEALAKACESIQMSRRLRMDAVEAQELLDGLHEARQTPWAAVDSLILR